MKIKLNPTALYAIKMSASNQNLRTSKAKLNTKIVSPFIEEEQTPQQTINMM